MSTILSINTLSQKLATTLNVISTSPNGRRPSPWQFALQIHCSSSDHSWNILSNLLFTSVTVLQSSNSRWNCTQIFALLPLLSSSLLTSANQLDRQHWRTMSRGRQSALRKCSRTEPLTLPCSEIQWIALILEMLKCRNTKLNRWHKFELSRDSLGLWGCLSLLVSLKSDFPHWVVKYMITFFYSDSSCEFVKPISEVVPAGEEEEILFWFQLFVC